MGHPNHDKWRMHQNAGVKSRRKQLLKGATQQALEIEQDYLYNAHVIQFYKRG